MESCSSSASRSLNPVSRSIWSNDVDRRPRDGAPSCVTTHRISPPWTCSLFQLLALICSIRRDCVDHVVTLGEAHLRRILTKYAAYYNELRTHRSLDKDAPIHRTIQHAGRIISAPVLGGLHHHYCRI